MKIVYLHQFYITPKEAGGTRSYYLSQALSNAGHDVVMITSNIKHRDWPFLKRESHGKVRILYINNHYDPRMGKLARIVSYLRFVIISSFYAWRERDVDMVYASSTPITIGLPALLCRWRSKSRFVFELRDLWPDVPYELGYIKSRVLYRTLKAYEHYLYRKADRIITISEGIKHHVGDEWTHKTMSVPFGANIDLFSSAKNSSWKSAKGIQARHLYVMSGAISVSTGMEYLISVAQELQERGERDIHIAIIGTGSARPALEARIAELELANLSLHKPVAIEHLNEVYASADGGIILFGAASGIHRFTASPNKFFDYIAAGLPLFFNFDGPLKDEIIREGIGVHSPSDNPGAMADALSAHSRSTKGKVAESVRIRNFAEENYDRKALLRGLRNEIESIG